MTPRVLHVIPALAARYGGPSMATIGMCRALMADGVSTLAVATDADGVSRLPVALEQVQDYEGVPAMFFRRRVSESFKWSRPLGLWLKQHVAEFDVVHVHAVFSHSSIAAGRACVASGVPYIVRPLGTLDPWSVHRKRFRKQVLFRLGVADLLSRADAMHYTSDEEMRLAETVVPGLPPGIVVPLGIDDALFAPTDDRAAQRPEPYLLALSRLDEKKGFELLISAFHSIATMPELEPWTLAVAGDGDAAYVAELKRLAAAGPGAARIRFLGWVNGAVKTVLLRQAGLFVTASHQENFGISLVEALASGVPALVTPGVNLAEEIVAARAGWTAPRSEHAFATALAAAIGDTTELRRRGDRARAYAERFRWPLVARSLRDMYASVITTHQARFSTVNSGTEGRTAD